MAQAKASPVFNPPRQARSELTLERVLEVAREMLASKSFDNLPLAEVARRAGVTVGAVYSRFPSKEALFQHLERGTLADIQQQMAQIFASQRDDDRDLETVLRQYLDTMQHTYREHRGVLREWVIGSWSDPEKHARRMESTRHMLGMATKWMLGRPGTVGHPRPQAALHVALLFGTAALRDAVLLDDTWVVGPAGVSSTEDLRDEILRAMLAYIEYGPPSLDEA